MATSGKPDIRWDKKSNRDEIQRYLAMGGVLFLTCALIIIFYFCVKRYDGLKAGWDGFVRVLAPFLVGAVMALIRECQPQTIQEWEQWCCKSLMIGFFCY